MEKITAIYFDMDGTIADLYGSPQWLADLEAHNPRPYAIAKPMHHMSSLARQINTLTANGINMGIISWLSKTGTPQFNTAVTEVKRKWLKTHLASVCFNDIAIIEYGIPKSTANTQTEGICILFDDEEKNRIEWENARSNNLAFAPNEINKVLKNILKNFSKTS